MMDQSVGRSTQDVVKGLMGMTVKWTLLAVVLAMVDARMGGRPKLLEVLRGGIDGVRGRLPL